MPKTATAITADNTPVEFILTNGDLARPTFVVVARADADAGLEVTDTICGNNPEPLVESARRLTEVYGWAHAEVCPVARVEGS